MKPTKITITILLNFALVFTGILSMAQAPEKVSYQSLIRDASGELVRSQSVGIQISILQGSTEASAVYVETHTPVTNINGLVTIEIGAGVVGVGTFSSIDWGSSSYFLKVETDPAGGTTYTITGTSEIMSVPYALNAKTVENESQTLADVLAENNDANGQIKNVTDPTDAQDAVTKAYVDELKAEIITLKNINEAGGGLIDARDGNYYNTVKIGTQVWMAENLAYLPAVSPPEDGSEDTEVTDPYYYVFDYSGSDVSAAKATANYSSYGVLYNWPAALTACPSGWHLPTDVEWTTLKDYLTNNGYGYEGSGTDIGKSMSYTSGWNVSDSLGAIGNDQASNNNSGFAALPAGFRNHRNIGSFGDFGEFGNWWSATENSNPLYANYLDMYYDRPGVGSGYYYKEDGFSVRCVRD